MCVCVCETFHFHKKSSCSRAKQGRAAVKHSRFQNYFTLEKIWHLEFFQLFFSTFFFSNTNRHGLVAWQNFLSCAGLFFIFSKSITSAKSHKRSQINITFDVQCIFKLNGTFFWNKCSDELMWGGVTAFLFLFYCLNFIDVTLEL